MSVRVVARIRPLLAKELDKDVIVRADGGADGRPPNVVKIPSPKNEAEEFSFAFNGVYDQATSQEELFNAEVAPHIKALFQGLDITLFAYGVTGTGKTHTMRGGMKLADRGVIPRLLSHVFRRGKKIAKDSAGATTVEVALAYYEIYNDKVYDLLVPPETRTPAGLPLRESRDNKTCVVGLSEQVCVDLRDFERLYVAANQHRVTAATKLNAHSSRSHAVLRVKVTQTACAPDGSGAVVSVRESTASAIDLAGSEDNRRTDNGRERLVESAAINKSLFVLSQCVDAIARGEKRIPYRESKMTRILSLGQNQGITVMILNLAPVRSYHLDTLSSLNVSSRAKRIEVREIENEVVFKQPPRSLSSTAPSTAAASTTSLTSSSTTSSLSSVGGVARQPLRALTSNTHNIQTGLAAATKAAGDKPDKPVKAFSVYTDRASGATTAKPASTSSSNATAAALPRPSKLARPSNHRHSASNIARLALAPLQAAPAPAPAIAPAPAAAPLLSAEQIEAIIERKVAEALAARAEQEQQKQEQQKQEQQQQLAQLAALEFAAQQDSTAAFTMTTSLTASSTQSDLGLMSEAVQRRLDALERRIDDSAAAAREDDPRAQGLRCLLLARQHKEVGDDAAALRCYEQAVPFFPGQAKLLGKVEKLRAKMARDGGGSRGGSPRKQLQLLSSQKRKRAAAAAAAAMTPTTPTFRRGFASDAAYSTAYSAGEDDGEAATGDGGHESDADAEDDEDEAAAAAAAAAEKTPSMPSTPSTPSFLRRRRGGGGGGKHSPSRKAAKTSLLGGPSGSANGDDADDESRALASSVAATAAMTPRKKKLLDIVNSRDVARIGGLAGVGARTARGLVAYLESGGGVGGGVVAGEDDVDDDHEADEGMSPAATATAAPAPPADVHRIETLAQLRNVPGIGGETVERAYEGLVAAST